VVSISDRFKVFKAVPSLAVYEPPMRFEPRTPKLRGWIVDFPSQVPRRLLEYPEHLDYLR